MSVEDDNREVEPQEGGSTSEDNKTITVNGKEVSRDSVDDGAEENSTNTEEGSERPEYVPEKFWDSDKGEVRMEDVFKSMNELESKLSSDDDNGEGSDDEKDANEEESDDSDEEDSEEEYEDPSEAVQAQIDEAAQEFTDNGDLSEETIASLEESGLPRQFIDTYVDGVKALQEQMTSTAHELAGGEESYQAMLKWASENLSEEEAKDFDARVSNPRTYQDAIRSLTSRYHDANGNDGERVDSSNKPSNEKDVFNSKNEMLEAMRDPRYKTDPNYRTEVAAKIRRSQREGKKLVSVNPMS